MIFLEEWAISFVPVIVLGLIQFCSGWPGTGTRISLPCNNIVFGGKPVEIEASCESLRNAGRGARRAWTPSETEADKCKLVILMKECKARLLSLRQY